MLSTGRGDGQSPLPHLVRTMMQCSCASSCSRERREGEGDEEGEVSVGNGRRWELRRGCAVELSGRVSCWWVTGVVELRSGVERSRRY